MSKFDDIKIPDNLKLETHKTIEKAKFLKIKHKFKYIKVASIFIFCIGIGIVSLSYSSANNVPFINDIFEKISFISYHPKNYTEYYENVDISKTINGITFTINDVVYDGHQLNFTYTIKSQNKLPRQNSGFYKDVLLLEEILTIKDGYVVKGDTVVGEYINDYTYTLMQSYNINYKGKKSPDEIKIDFVLNKIFTCSDSGNVEDSINETFDFKLKLKPNVPANIIDVNETKDGLTVQSLEITPYSTSINIKFPKSLISNIKGKESSVSLSTEYIGELPSKIYDTTFDTNTYKVKRGIVFDSVVNDNVYNIGSSESNDYVIVKFKNFNNQSGSDVTEFRIKIK